MNSDVFWNEAVLFAVVGLAGEQLTFLDLNSWRRLDGNADVITVNFQDLDHYTVTDNDALACLAGQREHETLPWKSLGPTPSNRVLWLGLEESVVGFWTG